MGYPGSIVATWQRGGRVGRSGQPSALVLIAGCSEDDCVNCVDLPPPGLRGKKSWEY